MLGKFKPGCYKQGLVVSY